MVRMERSFRVLLAVLSSWAMAVSRPMETASTASATAISSRLGSKIMLSPTEITRRVTGGRKGWSMDGVVVVAVVVFVADVAELGIFCCCSCARDGRRGYRYSAAAQSSSNMGSSSSPEMRRGNFVERRARCVVSERSGRGYERGGETRRICADVSICCTDQAHDKGKERKGERNQVSHRYRFSNATLH